jgi:hypothetical protein
VNNIEKNIFTALVEVYRWEWDALPSMRSLVGRHVYFCIAREVLRPENARSGQPLKLVLFHPEFTPRAIRMKLREFELEGLIEFLPHETDKRSRRLVPTQSLLNIMGKHAQMLHQTIEKTTYCVEKN